MSNLKVKRNAQDDEADKNSLIAQETSREDTTLIEREGGQWLQVDKGQGLIIETRIA